MGSKIPQRNEVSMTTSEQEAQRLLKLWHKREKLSVVQRVKLRNDTRAYLKSNDPKRIRVEAALKLQVGVGSVPYR
jgi:hypothetical protein